MMDNVKEPRWRRETRSIERWTSEDLDELLTEINKRWILDPLWKVCADAIGSLRFDLVDAKAQELRRNI